MPRKSKPWFWKDRGRWATTVDGKRIVAPAEIVTEHEAWAWHAEVMDELKPKPISRATTTVQDVLDAYAGWDLDGAADGSRPKATANNNLSCIQTIINTKIGRVPFGTMLVSRTTPIHYDALIAAWRKAGYKPNYVANLAQKLKTMLAWGARETIDRRGLIEASPFADCPSPLVPAPGERYGDRGTAARWLRYLWRAGLRDDATFQRCLVHTGARPSELAWATWGDVRWDATRDSVGNPMAIVSREEWKNSAKTGKTRRIFLPARLVRSMRRRMGDQPGTALIFPRPDGGRPTSQDVANRTIRLRANAKKAGVVLVERNGAAITNYLWRHVAASDLLMGGVDVATTAELLGTSVAQIQRTYGHLLEDHLAAASEKVGRRR